MRSAFKHCTLLVIAHRLDTILDSDKILIMRAGWRARLLPALA